MKNIGDRIVHQYFILKLQAITFAGSLQEIWGPMATNRYSQISNYYAMHFDESLQKYDQISQFSREWALEILNATA